MARTMIPEEVQKKITALIEKTSLVVDEISFSYDEKDGSCWCRVRTSEPRKLIGRHGETLRALNHIARKMIQREFDSEKVGTTNLLIDVNNYQQERVDNLRTLAHMLAERARFFKSSIEADPMSAFERRIIHEHLSEEKDVKTESVGEGKNRRVTISYVVLDREI